jgi:hypothetical protein
MRLKTHPNATCFTKAVLANLSLDSLGDLIDDVMDELDTAQEDGSDDSDDINDTVNASLHALSQQLPIYPIMGPD